MIASAVYGIETALPLTLPFPASLAYLAPPCPALPRPLIPPQPPDLEKIKVVCVFGRESQEEATNIVLIYP